MIYLNNGTHSLTMTSVLKAQKHYLQEYEKNPTQGLISAYQRFATIHQQAAKFFEAPRNTNMILRSNVTELMNEFILGVQLKGSILTSNLEYGAVVNICRYKAECEQVKLKFFSLPLCQTKLTTSHILKSIEQALTRDIKMLVLSHVLTGTGLVLPIADIARLTRKKGVILVVDGAHSMGSIKVSFTELADVDFYASNFHKWMMGPKGVGMGFVNSKSAGLTKPLLAGWMSYSAGFPYNQVFGTGSFKERATSWADQMLMVGCQDFSRYFAVTECLKEWQKMGPAKIFAELKARQLLVVELAKKHGFELLSPGFNSGSSELLQGPLLAFALPKKFQNRQGRLAYELNANHQLQIATPLVAGQTVLRISPHIYNSAAEIKAGFKILKQKIG